MFPVISELPEAMDIPSVRCFQYLCIAALFLQVGFALINKYEHLERKIKMTATTELNKTQYRIHLFRLKTGFFDDFCQQDLTENMMHPHCIAFAIYASYFITTGLNLEQKPEAK
jgi:hypothetical protein